MAYRKELLAAYLKDNPVWQEYIELLEESFGDEYDRAIDALALSRNLHLFEETTPDKMLSTQDTYLSERSFLVAVAQMMGFNYPNFKNKLFTTEDYLRLAQYVGQYMKAQGYDTFIDFFAYCFNTQMSLTNLWTDNYIDFVPEGDSRIAAIDPSIIGASRTDQGGFYPTSHVTFDISPYSTFNLTTEGFISFFNYVAPINLVLESVRFHAKAESQVLKYAMAGYTIIVQGFGEENKEDFNMSMSGNTVITY